MVHTCISNRLGSNGLAGAETMDLLTLTIPLLGRDPLVYNLFKVSAYSSTLCPDCIIGGNIIIASVSCSENVITTSSGLTDFRMVPIPFEVLLDDLLFFGRGGEQMGTMVSGMNLILWGVDLSTYVWFTIIPEEEDDFCGPMRMFLISLSIWLLADIANALHDSSPVCTDFSLN